MLASPRKFYQVRALAAQVVEQSRRVRRDVVIGQLRPKRGMLDLAWRTTCAAAFLRATEMGRAPQSRHSMVTFPFPGSTAMLRRALRSSHHEREEAGE
jgi:hypothetical protein